MAYVRPLRKEWTYWVTFDQVVFEVTSDHWVSDQVMSGVLELLNIYFYLFLEDSIFLIKKLDVL